ncbi:hypothetical protein KAU45_05100, partial [bacterium]|nr:hypothetical protein [bacterium]
FLNSHSDFTVAALELEYIADEKVEMLIPRLHGGNEDKEAAGRSTGRKLYSWDEQSFFEKVAELDEERQRVIKELYEFTVQEAKKLYWAKGIAASFGFKVRRLIFSVFIDENHKAGIWVNIENFFRDWLETAVLKEYKNKIRSISGRAFDGTQGSFKISILADETKMREFKETVLWFKGQIESS